MTGSSNRVGIHSGNAYRVLGLDRGCSNADIQRAYRRLARVLHPDAGGEAAKFTELQEAYDAVRTPSRRADYDRMQAAANGVGETELGIEALLGTERGGSPAPAQGDGVTDWAIYSGVIAVVIPAIALFVLYRNNALAGNAAAALLAVLVGGFAIWLRRRGPRARV